MPLNKQYINKHLSFHGTPIYQRKSSKYRPDEKASNTTITQWCLLKGIVITLVYAKLTFWQGFK